MKYEYAIVDFDVKQMDRYGKEGYRVLFVFESEVKNKYVLMEKKSGTIRNRNE